MAHLARWIFPCVFVSSLLLGCSDDGNSDEASASGGSSSAGTAGEGGSSSAGTAGMGGSGGGEGGSGGSASAGLEPMIPEPSGSCPSFESGVLSFSPGGAARSAQVWVSDAAQSQAGPLLFFWHGAGGQPIEASYVLGSLMDEVLAQGGVVIAPSSDPGAGQFEWYLTTGSKEDDLLLADEIVGCAHQELGIDPHRIHTFGFSAGAVHTVQFMYRRSGYLASAVSFSGAFGLTASAPARQEPDNKFPMLLFHGGDSDQVVINFKTGTEAVDGDLSGAGQFSAVCDHGLGHTVPNDAPAAMWQFLQDHPWGTDPSPYESGLPGSFPSYCSL